jgi:hypothetical protein
MNSHDQRPQGDQESSHNADDFPANDEIDELNEIDPDDPYWDAFLADDDELDPQPEPGDFWPDY